MTPEVYDIAALLMILVTGIRLGSIIGALLTILSRKTGISKKVSNMLFLGKLPWEDY